MLCHRELEEGRPFPVQELLVECLRFHSSKEAEELVARPLPLWQPIAGTVQVAASLQEGAFLLTLMP